jgi:hypothetical protein
VQEKRNFLNLSMAIKSIKFIDNRSDLLNQVLSQIGNCKNL